ncbi:low temperature requirement protein A [Streptomyces avicenniae]|uniref:low temperature requirement protein A n=1 Tax=Streptomyces avicenniae TaxID=500153 RepID=UPI00069CB4E3|nr:low temperature requirement protein A [Streptomyces avicenniae]
MTARDREEENRSSTPLELFFDLCFVVAVAQISAVLHHFLTEGRVGDAVPGYLAAFFAVWWAWMGFTWFASAYDTDDVAYRLAAFVTITGALILASGVRRAFDDGDYALVTTGYAVSRLALISLWLRAARGDPRGRASSYRFAIGLAVVQTLWLLWLLLPPDAQHPLFPVLALLDVSVPLLGERARRTPWHPGHIAERYGSFTMIVLGESVLAASRAVQRALDADQGSGELYVLAGSGLLTVFAMWWLYFARPAEHILTSARAGFVWGYGHSLVFASATAVGAGLAVNVDHVTHHGELSATAAAATLTVPVAVYLITVWALQFRPHHARTLDSVRFPVAALLVLAGTFTHAPGLVTGLVTAALTAFGVVASHRKALREGRDHSSETPVRE